MHSHFGEMAEWSIAAVLKTVELRGSGGSNPSLSAPLKVLEISESQKRLILHLPNVKLGVFLLNVLYLYSFLTALYLLTNFINKLLMKFSPNLRAN